MSRKKIRNPTKKYCPLGKRIQKLQDLNGLKGYELALMLGISPTYLSDIKYGRSGTKGYTFWESVRRKIPEWEFFLKGRGKNPEKRINVIRIYDDDGNRVVNILPKNHVKYKIDEARPAGIAVEPEGLHGKNRHIETEEGTVSTTLYKPDRNWYHQVLDDILESADQDIVNAVHLVLLACHVKTKESKHLEDRIKKIENIILKQKPPKGEKERRSVWISLKKILQKTNGDFVYKKSL